MPRTERKGNVLLRIQTRKGSFHWSAAWKIVFLTNQCTVMHTVFAFSHPFWDKIFAFSHPFWDKVFAFSHPSWDKVFHFHTPKTEHGKMKNGPPATTRRRWTTLSSPCSVGCAADRKLEVGEKVFSRLGISLALSFHVRTTVAYVSPKASIVERKGGGNGLTAIATLYVHSVLYVVNSICHRCFANVGSDYTL